jgi:hypothetical protein
MIWRVNTLLRSAALAISVFCQAISITCHSKDVVTTKWSMTSSFTDSSRLLLTNLRTGFCNYSTEWPEIPPWYSNLLFGLYHIENSGCMGFVGVKQKVWNLKGAGRSTWVAEGCQSWQRHLSSWCRQKLRFLNWESSSDSTLFIVLESTVEPSIFPILIGCSILSANPHNIMSIFQCCCCCFRIVGNLPIAR